MRPDPKAEGKRWLRQARQDMDDARWQQQVAAFVRSHSLLHDPATHALDLVSDARLHQSDATHRQDHHQNQLHHVLAQVGLATRLSNGK